MNRKRLFRPVAERAGLGWFQAAAGDLEVVMLRDVARLRSVCQVMKGAVP